MRLAAQIVWSDGGWDTWRRANLDGSNQQDFFPTTGQVSDIVYNRQDGYVYWSTVGPGSTVYRGQPDGSGLETLFTRPQESIGTIAVDYLNQKIYRGIPTSLTVFRSNYDGTGDGAMVDSYDWIVDLVVDPLHDLVLWTDHENIGLSALDGSGFTTISSDTRPGQRVAIDPTTQQYYITGPTYVWGRDVNFDHEYSLDIQLDHWTFPTPISLDLAAAKIYWAESDIDAGDWQDIQDFSATKIRRANLDGTQIEDVILGIRPLVIEVVPEPTSGMLAAIGIAVVIAGRLSRRCRAR